ncbi:MAG: hypothetical protein QF903_07905 [Planctomycetota bacterium]|jgi:hypothetical protein|nr:hypothetical protein [Planctomycetota bacterium]MDP6989389.1 hypothetical protein [Planctomycetota bacterium]
MQRTSRLFALCLSLILAAGCSADPGQRTDAGHKALNSGDFALAYEQFSAAVGAFAADDPRLLEARLGQCRAQAHIDPPGAKDAFLALASGSSLEYRDFNLITTDFKAAGAYTEAIEVLGAGMQAFPENTALIALRDHMGKAAEASGDSDSLDALKGLGYVGND